MEVSSFPTSSRIHYCYSSSPVVLKRVGVPQRRQSSVSIALTGKTPPPLLHSFRGRFQDGGTLKVSCSSKSEASLSGARYIVGLAGPPGAGKSTLASEVVQRVNKMWPQKAPKMDEQLESPDVAVVLPMDGFHLYRHQLDAMEDPKEAHARRGAPWTFDPTKLLKCLRTLRSQGSVYAPSFDHGVGDPVDDDIFVSLQHKVVVVEGNYLLLEEGIWKDISTMFDEKWFIDVDLDTAMQRVLTRHISKSKKPPDEAKWRIEYNDRPNAEMIMKSKKNADLVIRSIESSP